MSWGAQSQGTASGAGTGAAEGAASGAAVGTLIEPGGGTVVGGVVGGVIGAVAGGVQGNLAGRAKKNARNAQAAAARAEAERENELGLQVTNNDQSYGVGTGPNAGENAANLDAFFGQTEGAEAAGDTAAAQNQFTAGNLADRQAAARSGQAGGSVDASSRRARLTQYVTQRQQALDQARSSGQNLANQVNAQRLSQDNTILGGTQATPGWQQEFNNANQNLSEARTSVVPTAIGNGVTQAGAATGQFIAGSPTPANVQSLPASKPGGDYSKGA